VSTSDAKPGCIAIRIPALTQTEDWCFQKKGNSVTTTRSSVAVLCKRLMISAGAALAPVGALAQPTLFEPFNTGTAGWSLYADGEQLAWTQFGGNPGGAITAKDQGQGGYWGFAAAPSFLGDRACFYGGLLRWQFNTTHSGSAINSEPDATLEGGGLVLVINLANPVVNTWETRSVPLLETAGWRVATLGGAVPTQTQFKSVLANVTAIKFRGEFSTFANDRCTLDNVSFGSFVFDTQPEGASICPDSIVTLSTSAQGVGPIGYKWQYETAPGVYTDVPNGAIPYAHGSVTAVNPGTNQMTLAFAATPGAPGLRFRCLVSNDCGSAPSDAVRVVPCFADLNCDSTVDDADFVLFLPAYNILDCADPAMPQPCPADFNNDGVVDDADFLLFLDAYNALACE